MRQYIISYDLYRPGHNYSDLTSAIKRLGEDWDHPLANFWIVDTDLSADEIRGHLSAHLVAGDKLYVREAGDDIASMDIAPGSPGRMTGITANVRTPGKLLAPVLTAGEDLPREVAGSTKLLTGATAESW
jgi:hypothetical protein